MEDLTLRIKRFDVTNHAFKRMQERDIPHPKDMGLRPANGKTIKLIKESCVAEGFNKEYVYWTQRYRGFRYVYVCVPKDINYYIVITCFKYAY